MSTQFYRVTSTDIVEVTDPDALIASALLFLEMVMEDKSDAEIAAAKRELRDGGIEFAFQVLAQVCAMNGVRTIESVTVSEPLADYYVSS